MILTRCLPQDQWVYSSSTRVRGIVKVQRKRSEIAKFAMKIFRGVNKTLKKMITLLKARIRS